MTNRLEERNSSSQWEVQSCFHGALIFFLLTFGFTVERLDRRFFFSSFIWCGKWTVQCPLRHWTFDASFIGGDGVRGKDLFSFQLIGRAKVPCFYFF